MLRITYVSFPGLGIPEIRLNSVAFTIFGHPVAWYGIIITFGIVLAALYVLYRAKQEGISADDILDLGVYLVLFSVLGARLFYVLTSLDEFDSFLDVFKIWNGGLAIYGAIIAGALTIFVYCRLRKRNFYQFLDMVAPAVMLGQTIGRWGNFMNGEAHGGITEIFCRMGLRYSEYGQAFYYHPTFLYESIWNLTGFILINIFYKRKRYNGQVVLLYLTWYGFGRMFIEQLRTDSLYLFAEVWFLKISSLIGLFSFLIFGGILLYHAVKGTRLPTAYSKNSDTTKE
ncbi:MAG: prolipoprotein diacylglyceryl transferase [Clostridia bacterium]|nr:prolipoprotein diacylglyceryl transferase [Clostridia bacterium]